MKLNHHPESLKVGDIVTTEYHFGGGTGLPRTVTKIGTSDITGSGYVVSMSATEPCPTCGHIVGDEIHNIDAAWAIPVEEDV